MIVQLVDKGSACIDGHEMLSLDAPHTMMNKFKGPGDPGFELVSGIVRRMVNKSEELLKMRGNGKCYILPAVLEAKMPPFIF
jgi:hypothetical protein